MAICSKVAWDGNDYVAYVARLMFNNLFRDQRSPLLTMTSVCATIPKGLNGAVYGQFDYWDWIRSADGLSFFFALCRPHFTWFPGLSIREGTCVPIGKNKEQGPSGIRNRPGV